MGSPGTQASDGREPRAGPCPHCGSSDVITGLKVNQSAEVGAIGLAYKAWGPLVGSEQLLADLCRACGTVVRLYVKDPRREWTR